MSTRVLAVSDLHCGHAVGLCPPGWRSGDAKMRRVEDGLWREWRKIVRMFAKPDVLLVVGDAIDGRGAKSGGTEQLTTDPTIQAEIAGECLEMLQARNVVMVYGTDYHVSDSGVDAERGLAKALGAKIGAHEWVKVGPVTFDVKHHIGSTSVPGNVPPSLGRESVWNALWHEQGEQPRGSIFVRGHLHRYCRLESAGVESVVCPALQAAGTRYGGRRCSGTVDWGVVQWTVGRKSVDFARHIVRLPETRAAALVL